MVIAREKGGVGGGARGYGGINGDRRRLDLIDNVLQN